MNKDGNTINRYYNYNRGYCNRSFKKKQPKEVTRTQKQDSKKLKNS